jgi:DUF438 domain-containing protein
MELMKQKNPRIERLVAYLEILVSGILEKEIYQTYSDVLETATPFEVNEALSAVLSEVTSFSSYIVPVSRFFRAVGKSLDKIPEMEYPKEHLLSRFVKENREIAKTGSELQHLSRQVQQGTAEKEVLIEKVASLKILEEHYTALQNELFPLFERATVDHACVKLMWSIQDSVLESQKKLVQTGAALPLPAFWKLFGTFFSYVEILIYRETKVLFPVSFRFISPEAFKGNANTLCETVSRFVSETGSLEFGELEAIFQLLPLDIAFIGPDDRVAFYSNPPHRIFPRSPAVIGRLVQNCHPPKSVAIVEKILASFKEGSKDSAEFYLTLGGRFVHIEYFAVKNNQGTYIGTLEVTQDATHLRSLTGEKRL